MDTPPQVPERLSCDARCGSGSPAVEVTLHSGTWWLCSCGLSDRMPFCDGAHRGTAMKPIPLVVRRSQAVAVCGCGRLRGRAAEAQAGGSRSA